MRALRRQLAAQFAAMAQDRDTPLSELRDVRDRLALLDAAAGDPALAAHRRRRRAAIAALLVAAVLSVAALIPMPAIPFVLEAEADAARLEMGGAGLLGPQTLAGPLRVDGYTELESPASGLTRQAGAQDGPLVLAAPSLNLRRVRYPAGSAIELAAGAGGAMLTIHSAQAPIELEVEFAGLTSAQFGQGGAGHTADYPYAEWLRVRALATAGRAPPPMAVTMPRQAEGPAAAGYRWTGLRPRQVRFVERVAGPNGEVTVSSSLSKARIQLQASADEVQLGPGEELELGGLELQRCEVLLGQVLRISMTGTARTLQTRTGRFARSFKPSVLEYAARHKTVALLWSAALFIWGVVQWLQRVAGSGD
jgi:hypothetical protein